MSRIWATWAALAAHIMPLLCCCGMFLSRVSACEAPAFGAPVQEEERSPCCPSDGEPPAPAEDDAPEPCRDCESSCCDAGDGPEPRIDDRFGGPVAAGALAVRPSGFRASSDRPAGVNGARAGPATPGRSALLAKCVLTV